MSETLDDYKNFVSGFVSLHKKACDIELGAFSDAPYGDSDKKALIFSPHPDDECVLGALPYRH